MNNVTPTKIHDLSDALGVLRDLIGDDDAVPHLHIATYKQQLILGADQYGILIGTPEEKRETALAFLATWTQRLHKAGTIVKAYGEDTVAVEITLESGWTIRAEVNAAEACTFEPVYDDDGQPVMEAKDVSVYQEPVIESQLVPVTRRVCEDSWLKHLPVEA